MDASAWVGLVAAALAGIAAWVSWHQAKSAKAQVEIAKKAVEVAEEANRLTALALEDEKQSRQLKLDIRVTAPKKDNNVWLLVTIENNGAQVANIQSIAAVFVDGTRYETGDYSGELIPRSGTENDFPAELSPGHACEFRFTDFEVLEIDAVNIGGGISKVRTSHRIPVPFANSLWRGLMQIEVRANNQVFVMKDENAHWYHQIRYGYAPSQEPDPDLLPKSNP